MGRFYLGKSQPRTANYRVCNASISGFDVVDDS